MTLHRRLAQRGAMLPTPLAPNLLALLTSDPILTDARRTLVAFVLRVLVGWAVVVVRCAQPCAFLNFRRYRSASSFLRMHIASTSLNVMSRPATIAVLSRE